MALYYNLELIIAVFVGLIIFRVGKLVAHPDFPAFLKGFQTTDMNESLKKIGKLMKILGVLWVLLGICKYTLIKP